MFKADLAAHGNTLHAYPRLDIRLGLIKSDVLPSRVRRCGHCQRMQ